jgi:hypothetical protein
MRRVPAILMVIFFAAPLLFTALMTISVSTWVLDRGFYTAILDDEQLYQLPDGSGDWWGGEVSGLQGMNSRAAMLAAREVLAPSWMRTQAVGIANQVFDYLQGRAGGFDLTIDLAPVKAALRGEPGKRFAQTLARELPVGGSTADFVVRARSLPRSRPSSVSVEKAAAVILAGLPAFIASIPDTARLSDEPTFLYSRTWAPGFPALGALIFADLVLLVLAAGFLVGAAFVGGATRFERLQWLGWPLLVPAVGVFLIGLLVSLGVVSGWMHWGLTQAHLETQGFTTSFVDAVARAAARALARVGTGFIATGAIAGGAALGLLAWSWSIPPSARSPQIDGTAA